MPLEGGGGPMPNGKSHDKFPFFFDPFHKSQVLSQNKDTSIDFTNLTLIGCKCIGFLL